MTPQPQSQITLYQTAEGSTELDVHIQADTVWLRQEQMSELFGRERSVITKHLRNIFAEGELDADSVCANVAHTAEDGKTYQVKHYNLDVIISVGYRVKSVQGTRFRQWATQVLRQHLVQGYSLHQVRFEQNAAELEQALALIRKAANLLYFVVKNHPFTDGNKRSGAFLFVDFLHRNGRLLNTRGEPVINDTGLAALPLLVAESDPRQKDTLIRLIMNMLAAPEHP
ncbi:virulence protein RhuM/Fic/DOC family protein [Pseudomonas sp. UBA7530]|uniref:virulence protein RhuM/Fic/DOC family protein n=1 Tax=Pseudomonas sp. UBA7530 TaxID=1947341 RepID=UPI0025E7DA0F|nr:virulence protein RhuM/Fic/DOC family protein [Pseudomonas sp. UBA7530]